MELLSSSPIVWYICQKFAVSWGYLDGFNRHFRTKEGMMTERNRAELAEMLEGISHALTEIRNSLNEIKLRLDVQEETNVVSVELMREALERIPLRENTLTLLRIFCEYEGYVTRPTIYEAANWEERTFRQVLGSLTRRIGSTRDCGNTEPSSFYECRLIESSNEWGYRLRRHLIGVVREILEREE